MTTQTTTAATDQGIKERNSITILKRCMVLVLSCGALGNTRNVRLDNIELRQKKQGKDGAMEVETITAEARQLALQKRLLSTETLSKPLRVLDGAKNYLKGVAIQGHRVFGPGTYLIPNAMVTEVHGRLLIYRADLALAVREFVGLYKAEVEKRRVKLGQLFDEKDYMSPEDAGAQFALDWDYRRFDAPDNLETVDQAIFEATQQKHQAQLAAAYDEVEAGLMQGALTVMRELQVKLEPKADGARKGLRAEALDELKEYLRTLPFRNVTDNDQLLRIMADVQQAAAGIDVEDLKGSKHVRNKLLTVAQTAVQHLDTLLQERGGRTISLGGKIGG
jgi:hypothetical protein